VDAVAELARRGVDAHLLVAGEGGARASLLERARRHGVGDRVDLRGRIPHDRMPDFLASLHAFAQPSFSEGEPRAVLEAMASGLAVVVSDLPAHALVRAARSNAATRSASGTPRVTRYLRVRAPTA